MKFVKRTFQQLVDFAKTQKNRTDTEWDLLDSKINGPANVGKEVKDYVKPKKIMEKDRNK
jgi:RNAse (barnase) inhibitor barstar